MLAHLGAQADHIAVDRDMNVLLGHTGHFGLHGVAAIGFLHIHLDLRGRRYTVAMQWTHIKAGGDVLEEVIEQTATCNQRIHGEAPERKGWTTGPARKSTSPKSNIRTALPDFKSRCGCV